LAQILVVRSCPSYFSPAAAANPRSSAGRCSFWPSASLRAHSLRPQPSLPCPRPSRPNAARMRAATAAVTDRLGLRVIPVLSPSSSKTPPLPPSLLHARLLRVAHTPRRCPGPYLSRRRHPGAPTRNPSRHRATAPRHPNPIQAPPLSFCHFAVTPSTRSCPGASLGCTPVPLVRVADLHSARTTSLEFHRRRHPPLSRAPSSSSVSHR
jgi:hypothetical protein